MRPNPNFGAILEDEPNATSSYNSLQISVNKRFSHGLEFTSNYTWSKCNEIHKLREDRFARLHASPPPMELIQHGQKGIRNSNRKRLVSTATP